MNNDQVIFKPEQEAKSPASTLAAWKVMAVDDDPDVLWLTRMVLEGLVYQDRPINLLEATNARQAENLLLDNPDTAVILLDVVMEEDDAGLQLVRVIRDQLNNQLVRIILRTGQPGRAPEEQVIIDYDINDYRDKASLTAQALKTTVISSLRGYEAIATVDQLNQNLENQVREQTKQLRETLNLLEEDEKAGKAVQSCLLPASKAELCGFTCESKLIPSMYLSGDFLDYFEIDANHLGFYMADVAGHGAGSALITVLVNTFFTGLLNQWKQNGEKIIFDPAMTLERLNRELLNYEIEKHLTCFYGVLRRSDNRLLYTPGGHYPFPIIWHADTFKVIETKGSAVGLFASAPFENNEYILPDEYKLGIFSDGILEITPGSNDDRKFKHLGDMGEDTGQAVNAACTRQSETGDPCLPDDVTFMTITRRKQNG